MLRIYREEVRPLVDIALDSTASMRLTKEKTERALELYALCHACAERAEAAPRVHAVWAGGHVRTSREEAAGHFLEYSEMESAAGLFPSWDQIPWRQGALRIVISDLLFPMDPEKALGPLVSKRGQVLILAPYDPSEADPDWRGDMDLRDCESGGRQEHRFDATALAQYRAAYETHFSAWRAAAKRRRVLFARIPADTDLSAALLAEAVPSGSFRIADR